MLLKDKVALVTGGTRGIGLSTVERFCEEGAKVFINGRNLELTATISNELNEKGYDTEPLCFNVADETEVKMAFREMYKKTKRLDILVNNAGILDDALIGMVSKQQIETTFATNTYSVLYTCQYASRLMARNNSGSIVNVASIIGTNGNSGQAVYSASKAAVIGITKSLAKELANQNIRVNSIAPGFIDTDMASSIPEDKYSERLNSIAMGRIGNPREVANASLLLASDYSSYITGQVLGVDGGMLI